MFSLTPLIPFEPVLKAEVPEGEGWLHQMKWDGVRMLAYFDGSELRLFNRKRRERTLHYPELGTPHTYCAAASFILDGEMIALGVDGKPSFHDIMRRDGIRKAASMEQARRQVAVTYMVFDILYCDGVWIGDQPYAERDALLDRILQPGASVQKVPSYADGRALFALMQQQGLEGTVSKKAASPYTCGGKDERWIKVKNYRDVIAVIGGFTLNGGFVNSLLIGVHDAAGRLHYIGHVGTGKLTKQTWIELTALLKPTIVERRPFAYEHPDMKGATWVEPRFTVKVQYAEWRWQEGRPLPLRQPSIQAFMDVPPEECVFPG